MASKFGGVAVEEQRGSRFGGSPVEKSVDADTQDWERAVLLPMETNRQTGERRLAAPQLAVDLGNALMAPGRALQGEFGMEVDPATGRPTAMTADMMRDTTGLAGVVGLGGTAAPILRSAAGGGQVRSAARRMVQRALRDDQVPPEEVGKRLADIGPDAVVADLGPRLQKQAQAIATMPGPGQKRVVSQLSERAAGTNARINTDVDATLGPAPIPSRVAAEIKANQEALRPDYEQVFRNGQVRAVDTQHIADHLVSQIVNLRGDAQKAAARVRGMLSIADNPGTLDPNPYTLFQTRQAIDGMLATEQNPKVIGVLSEARKMVDDELAAKVPGIKQVDARYEELARQGEALQTGQQALDSGRTALRPSELVEEIVGGAVPERGTGPSAVPFRLSQGARAEIDRLIGTKANDLQALRQAVGGDGDWNRARLAALFGAEKADRLLAIISREMRYRATADDALAGSRTQVLKAAQDEINGVTPKPGVVQSLGNIQFGTAAASAADKALGWIGKKGREKVNEDVARLLMMGPDAPGLTQQMRYVPSTLAEMAPSAFIRELMLRGEAPEYNLARYLGAPIR